MIIISGILTGIPSSIVVTPIDHTRIKMQNKNTQYKGSMQAGKEIFKNFGVKGLWKGLNVTMLREVIALGVYFGAYEAVVREFDNKFG